MADSTGIPWPTAPQQPQGGALSGFLNNPLLAALLKDELGGALQANPNAPRAAPAPAVPSAGPAPVTSAPLPPPGARTSPDVSDTPTAPATPADDATAENIRQNLKAARAPLFEELDNNPALNDKFKRIMANEQGANPQGVKMIAETAVNRALSLDTPLEQQLRWHRAEPGGYYAMGNMGRGALENPKWRSVLEDALQDVRNGSNEANLGTHNASGKRAAYDIATGGFVPVATAHGETFFAPGKAVPNQIKPHADWRARMMAPIAAAAPAPAPATTGAASGPVTGASSPATTPATTAAAPTKDDPWAALDAAAGAPATAPAATAPASGDPWAELDRAAAIPTFTERESPVSGMPSPSRGLVQDARDAFWRSRVGLGIRAGIYGDQAARRYLDAMNARPQRYTGGGDAARLLDLGEGLRQAPGVTLGGALAPALSVPAGALTARALPYALPFVQHPVRTMAGALGGSAALDALGLTNSGVLGTVHDMMDFYHHLSTLARNAAERRERGE